MKENLKKLLENPKLDRVLFRKIGYDISRMNSRTWEIIILYFQNKKTYKEIGKKYALSKERIRVIIDRFMNNASKEYFEELFKII